MKNNTMKIMTLFLLLTLGVTLFGCGSNQDSEGTPYPTGVATVQPTETPTPTPTQKPTPTPTPKPTVQAIFLSKNAVTLDLNETITSKNTSNQQ